MSTIRFSCNYCKTTVKAQQHMAGREAQCPNCKKLVVVPAANEVFSNSDDYGLAAMSVGDVDLEDMQRESEQANLLVAEPQPRPSSTAPVRRQTPSFASSEAAPRPLAKTNKRSSGNYPVLVRVSYSFRVLAAIAAVMWFFDLAAKFLGIDRATAQAREAGASISSAAQYYALGETFITGATFVCALVAASELIRVAIDIQNNTQATARRGA